WPENETLHSLPTIRTVEQMERFTVPEPGSGLWGQARDWWLEMRALCQDTKLTFRGVAGKVDVGLLGISGLSPHMIAIDLVGPDFYWWQVECPEKCHVFLSKITEGLMDAQRYFMTIDDRPRAGFGLAEDTAQIMSPAMFREFCVPYARKLFDTFGNGFADGRGMHMCGESTHLHQALVDDLQVSSFNVFGYVVDPKVAARNLGGRMCLWGNINPMLMLNGTREQVKQAAQAALEAMAPCGGFMLGDGANVCPGTPIENLRALTEASEEFGLPIMVPDCSARSRKEKRDA
ncbi:MAG: uroporphyrinogen decarboxylase family protein, partial [Candidatus Latescibacterota bacterium]